MQSIHMISQEEAERLHKLPEQEHASRLQVTARATNITMGSGQYRVVEPATFEGDVHSLLGTAEGTKKAKGVITRKHVALMLDTDTNLLVPMVPVVENGAAKPDTYRMLNYELTKVAYGPISKDRINKALENNNVEKISELKHRFIMPSVCLLPKNIASVRRPRSASAGLSSSSSSSSSKSAASTLGSSSSRVASIAASGGGKACAPSVADALAMAGKLQDERSAEVLLACQAILQACHDDKPDLVPGLLMGPLAATGAEDSTLPNDYLLAGSDKTPRKPTLHQQQIDLLNHVAVGSQLQFVGKYTINNQQDDVVGLPVAAAAESSRAKNSEPGADSMVVDRAVSVVSELSSSLSSGSAPLDQQPNMPAGKSASKSSSSSSSSSAAAAKRKPDDDDGDIVEVVANGKRSMAVHAQPPLLTGAARARRMEDLKSLIHENMPVFTNGMLSSVVHGAVMPEGAAMQGSWHAGESNQQQKLPPAIVSGMQLSDVWHDKDNKDRHERVITIIKKMRDQGVDGLSPTEKEAFSAATVARMMGDLVPVGSKTAYTNFVMGAIGLQFLGGALHGWLSADIDAQIMQVIEKVILPLVDEGDAARAATAKAEERASAAEAAAAAASSNAEAKAELVAVVAEKDALAAEKTKLEATINELQAQVKSQAHMLDTIKEELDKLKSKASDSLQTESNW